LYYCCIFVFFCPIVFLIEIKKTNNRDCINQSHGETVSTRHWARAKRRVGTYKFSSLSSSEEQEVWSLPADWCPNMLGKGCTGCFLNTDSPSPAQYSVTVYMFNYNKFIHSTHYILNFLDVTLYAALVWAFERLPSEHEVMGSSLEKKPFVMLGKASSYNYSCATFKQVLSPL